MICAFSSRILASLTAVGALFAVAPGQAQVKKDSLVLAMTLEPSPGLDPTGGAASAIAEVSLYNIFETLTKINSDSRTTPLLADSWSISPDLKAGWSRLNQSARSAEQGAAIAVPGAAISGLG